MLSFVGSFPVERPTTRFHDVIFAQSQDTVAYSEVTPEHNVSDSYNNRHYGLIIKVNESDVVQATVVGGRRETVYKENTLTDDVTSSSTRFSSVAELSSRLATTEHEMTSRSGNVTAQQNMSIDPNAGEDFTYVDDVRDNYVSYVNSDASNDDTLSDDDEGNNGDKYADSITDDSQMGDDGSKQFDVISYDGYNNGLTASLSNGTESDHFMQQGL